ncbi:MAG: maleylpyruvate isomerase family mycothiol-dependent enzyme [Actinomycetia bacterium]|nr:maleylpyruvate isomerase family mycothiol-dependent enzyme [Actinomycetes bacterium]
MGERETTVDNLNACYDSILALGTGLDEAGWATQSLCPDWNVQQLFGHLAGVETAMDGMAPTEEMPADFFASVGQYTNDAGTKAPAEVLADLTAVIDRRREQLGALDDPTFDAPCFTPVGPQTYGRFLAVRVFDFWVHEQDCRIPLNQPGHLEGGAAAQALDEVHRSLGYIIGKKAGAPDGSRVTLDVTGEPGRTMHVAIDGRAAVVDTLDDSTVTVTADHQAFLMLACGRVDPQAMIDAGRVSWSGDTALGEQIARNLAFTM